ncbi:flagellar biosynthesis protein FliQ [Candidatus Liberibacter asiaticus]|uniref:Flagellar biosynthetic protein FliQ n=2 Tax=Liberibacter asiaticus TaxID=34021 RepID=C6XF40_LIBAP|nr:flagellar biosynthesis protein FliQ [Candidatus Liberibacter asiaticus]ACT56992.1 flagellar biosynthesis protein FliQ [Candidatus Liberibacter asiaticus str. psy62]AGH17042.1 flagellar biosynthesis protein FliQ [Candidatus Liberibacter asiaticus str. gxpsy]ALK07369.1 flagellar biosynthesis protein FliQ [Candidatus Liberibacter asiaticus]ASK52861.1 flagellar biosynthetic protein FliQ [Candidatus Liberibacter asiaticus]AWL14179.1 flagellar biosynthetic protein FliQ [Candidatus Liberibacter as
MNEADVLEIARAAMWTILSSSAPVLFSAMFLGILIAFLQALTQIQEVTLTFVPKIIAVFITLIISAPFIGGQISSFVTLVLSRIQSSL